MEAQFLSFLPRERPVERGDALFVGIRSEGAGEKLSVFSSSFHGSDAFSFLLLVFLRRVLLVEDAVLLADEAAASETVLALETLCAVFQILALDEIVDEADVVTFVLRESREVGNLAIEETETVETISYVDPRPHEINAIFDLVRHEETVRAVLAFVEVIAGASLAEIHELCAVPGSAEHHIQESSSRIFVDAPRAGIEFLCSPLEFFLRQLFVSYAIRFVSQVRAENAVVAVAAVIEEGAVAAVPAVKREECPEALVRVDDIEAILAVERKTAELAVAYVDATVTVANVLTLEDRMAEVTIP